LETGLATAGKECTHCNELAAGFGFWVKCTAGYRKLSIDLESKGKFIPFDFKTSNEGDDKPYCTACFVSDTT
jgi:hypothetical protein